MSARGGRGLRRAWAACAAVGLASDVAASLSTGALLATGRFREGNPASVYSLAGGGPAYPVLAFGLTLGLYLLVWPLLFEMGRLVGPRAARAFALLGLGLLVLVTWGLAADALHDVGLLLG